MNQFLRVSRLPLRLKIDFFLSDGIFITQELRSLTNFREA